MHSVYFKIVITSLQQNAIALSYAFDWSEVMAGYLAVQSDISSLGVAYLEFSCLSSSLKNAFFTETLIYILGPLLMVAAVYVGSLVRVFCSADEELVDLSSSTTKWRLALRKAASSSVGVAILVLYMLQVSGHSSIRPNFQSDVLLWCVLLLADVGQAIRARLCLVLNHQSLCVC